MGIVRSDHLPHLNKLPGEAQTLMVDAIWRAFQRAERKRNVVQFDTCPPAWVATCAQMADALLGVLHETADDDAFPMRRSS